MIIQAMLMREIVGEKERELTNETVLKMQIELTET